MIEKLQDLDSIIFIKDEDENDEEIKSNKESLKDDDDNTQLEKCLNLFLEKGFDDDDISLSDLNSDFDKMQNVSNEIVGKSDKSDKNSIKNEFENDTLQEILEINSMNDYKLEHLMISGYFSDKKNLTYSPFLNWSSFIELPNSFNTLEQKIKKKITNNSFIKKKRKFDHYQF